MSKIELIATAAFGLESLVVNEVKKLGYTEPKIERGQITYQGDELAVCRSNLWLRCADRVLIKIAEFEATTFDELFDQTKALSWHQWLPRDAEFPVTANSIKSQLSSVPACQSIMKKAVVAALSEHYGINWFDETGDLYKIHASIVNDKVTLTLDTTGLGLHKRGYRDLTSGAPLKETLAAALIYLSRWRSDRQLIDPLCGSGTIPIEAAMIGWNIAPGLRRKFAAEKWSFIPKYLWQQAREEATDLIKQDEGLRILGYDQDKNVLKLARHHAKQAGVDHIIDFHQLSVAELKSRKKYGYIICNPPYGERLSNTHEIKKLYREMGNVFAALGDGTWSFYVITSFNQFEKYFGTIANKKRKLFNGRIKTNYYQFFGPKPPK